MKNTLLLLLLLTGACKSKSSACTNVAQTLDPITKELDAVAALTSGPTPPSPGDQASCGQLTEQVRRVEGAQAKLAVVMSDDATLAKHVDTYRKSVDEWAKATKKAQAACLSRDGNAMTSALSESIRHRSQLGPAAAEITSYCKSP
jgi:hypothetical protein